MKLRGRQPETGRRRPAGSDLGPRPSTFNYRSRRSESSFNMAGRQNSKVQVERPKPPRGPNFWLQRAGLFILVIAALFSLTNILTVSSRAKILPMVSGQNRSFLRTESQYQAAADELLADSVWNRNKITINSRQLSDGMKARFPELAAVGITIPLLSHRPLVYIEPSQPALILIGKSGSFVVDNYGKALIKADSPEALNQPDLPKLNDLSGLTVRLNRQALPADDVAFIETVAAQLKARRQPIDNMSLPSGTRELNIQPAGKPYTIKFNLMAGKAREQAGAYLATIEQLNQQGVTPAKYVDVRVLGRAYYQ